MDFFSALEVSASGLAAERTRINVASSNLANVNTTRGADGGAYQRQDVLLSARPASEESDNGLFRVQVDGVQPDPAPPRMEYDPGHPTRTPRATSRTRT